jgi:hypothetical protein
MIPKAIMMPSPINAFARKIVDRRARQRRLQHQSGNGRYDGGQRTHKTRCPRIGLHERWLNQHDDCRRRTHKDQRQNEKGNEVPPDQIERARNHAPEIELRTASVGDRHGSWPSACACRIRRSEPVVAPAA